MPIAKQIIRLVIMAVGAETLVSLVLIASSGCAARPDTKDASPHVNQDLPPPAGGFFNATVRPQETSDLILLFNRRTIASLDVAAGPAGTHGPRSRLFAVLVNGAMEGHHQTNIFLASNALKQLGVDPRNIFILSTGIPWLNAAAYDPAETPFRVTARPTTTNLKLILDYLGGVVTSNDVVLLYLTGHGGKEDEYQALYDLGKTTAAAAEFNLTNRSTIVLQGASLTALDFKHQLEHLQRAGQPLIVFLCDECFGGGMAQVVPEAVPRYIAMAITDDSHITTCWPFAPVFWKTLSTRNPATGAYPALKSAFDEAMVFHRRAKKLSGPAGVFSCSDGLNDFSISRVR